MPTRLSRLRKSDLALRLIVGFLIFLLGGLGALALILTLPSSRTTTIQMESESPSPETILAEPRQPANIERPVPTTAKEEVQSLPPLGEVPYGESFEYEEWTYEEWYEEWTGPSY